jgi:hypothetical protein
MMNKFSPKKEKTNTQKFPLFHFYRPIFASAKSLSFKQEDSTHFWGKPGSIHLFRTKGCPQFIQDSPNTLSASQRVRYLCNVKVGLLFAF